MKKIQSYLVLLGLLNLLIPLGILAQYLIAVLSGGEYSLNALPLSKGILHLVFGVTFIFLGIRLVTLLKEKPKLPRRLMDGWVILNVILAITGSVAGYGVNPVALAIIAAIHWYFSRAFKRLLEEYAE